MVNNRYRNVSNFKINFYENSMFVLNLLIIMSQYTHYAITKWFII